MDICSKTPEVQSSIFTASEIREPCVWGPAPHPEFCIRNRETGQGLPKSLSPGQSVDLDILFDPTRIGRYSTNVMINFDNVNEDKVSSLNMLINNEFNGYYFL